MTNVKYGAVEKRTADARSAVLASVMFSIASTMLVVSAKVFDHKQSGANGSKYFAFPLAENKEIC